MDPERWPPGIRAFIDQKGSQANGELVVEVRYAEPVWTVELGCPCCHLTRMWNLVGEAPLPGEPEPIAVPSSFKELFS